VTDLRSRQMSSEQVTAGEREPAAAGRLTGILEENGLLVILLGAFAIVLVVGLHKELVVDGWMALVSGRWVAQHGLPTHDALTVWAHGKRWIDQQWLAQMAFYGLWRLGGVRLILLVHAALATSGIVGAGLLGRRLGGTARSVTWVALPAIIAYYPVASVLRPQSFAFPLFIAVLWLVLTDAREPSRRVFVTLPLLVLWANLHGSVLLGAGLVSLAGLIELIQQRRPSGRGLALLLVPWACLFVSPYALHMPAYYQKILAGGDFKQFVTEWAPTTLTATTAPVYLLVLGGLWLLGRTYRAVPVLDQLAFVVVAILSFQAIRNIAWIALVGVAVLPQLLDRLRQPAEEPRRLNRILSLTILASAVISLAGVLAKPTSWFTTAFPVAAARATAAAAGSDGQVFATSPYADWVLWAEPQLAGRVAFDARFELYSPAQLKHLQRFEARVGGWLTEARRYRVFVLDRRHDRVFEHALLRKLPARVVFSSPQVVVLRRTG
jgi:hypothetical protein